MATTSGLTVSGTTAGGGTSGRVYIPGSTSTALGSSSPSQPVVVSSRTFDRGDQKITETIYSDGRKEETIVGWSDAKTTRVRQEAEAKAAAERAAQDDTILVSSRYVEAGNDRYEILTYKSGREETVRAGNSASYQAQLDQQKAAQDAQRRAEIEAQQMAAQEAERQRQIRAQIEEQQRVQEQQRQEQIANQQRLEEQRRQEQIAAEQAAMAAAQTVTAPTAQDLQQQQADMWAAQTPGPRLKTVPVDDSTQTSGGGGVTRVDTAAEPVAEPVTATATPMLEVGTIASRQAQAAAQAGYDATVQAAPAPPKPPTMAEAQAPTTTNVANINEQYKTAFSGAPVQSQFTDQEPIVPQISDPTEKPEQPEQPGMKTVTSSRVVQDQDGQMWTVVTYSDGTTERLPYKASTVTTDRDVAPPDDSGTTPQDVEVEVDPAPVEQVTLTPLNNANMAKEINRLLGQYDVLKSDGSTDLFTRFFSEGYNGDATTWVEQLNTYAAARAAELSAPDDDGASSPDTDYIYAQNVGALLEEYPAIANAYQNRASDLFFEFGEFWDGEGDMLTAMDLFFQTKNNELTEQNQMRTDEKEAQRIIQTIREDPFNRDLFNWNELNPAVRQAVTKWLGGDEYYNLTRGDGGEGGGGGGGDVTPFLPPAPEYEGGAGDRPAEDTPPPYLPPPVEYEDGEGREGIQPPPMTAMDAFFAAMDTATTREDVVRALTAFQAGGGAITDEQIQRMAGNAFPAETPSYEEPPAEYEERGLSPDQQNLLDTYKDLLRGNPSATLNIENLRNTNPEIARLLEEWMAGDEFFNLQKGIQPPPVEEPEPQPEPEPEIKQSLLDSISDQVQNLIGELGFDSDTYEEQQLQAIEADYQASRERLARQFAIDPGGTATGRAQRAFEVLENERIQRRAEIRRDVADRVERALQTQLEGLSRVFQIAATTDLEQQRIDANNAQFQETMALELRKFGLNEIQIAAAIRQINADIADKTRRTSADIAQTWATITGQTGTQSGSITAADLGIDLTAEDTMSIFMPGGDAAKRQMLAQGFESMTGRTPTTTELQSLLGGGSVKVDSMPTLEARKAAADIVQQNMERFSRYAAIAEQNGLERDKFDEAKITDDRNWAMTTGQLAGQFGLDQTTFSQAQWTIDKYNNNLFFDTTLTAEQKTAMAQDYAEVIARQFFPGKEAAFQDASAMFSRTIGNQQRATAVSLGMEADNYVRAARQADQAENRYADTWSSVVSNAKKINAGSLLLSGKSLAESYNEDGELVVEVLDDPSTEAVDTLYRKAVYPVLGVIEQLNPGAFKPEQLTVGTGEVGVDRTSVFYTDYSGLTAAQIENAVNDIMTKKGDVYENYRSFMEQDYGHSVIITDQDIALKIKQVLESVRAGREQRDQKLIAAWQKTTGTTNTWWKDMGPEQRAGVLAMLGFSTAGSSSGGQQQGGIWGTLGSVVALAYGAYQGYQTGKGLGTAGAGTDNTGTGS